MSRRVIHTGQALVDLVLEVPELPMRGGNVNAGSVERYAGGAVNILVAAARSGARAVLAGSHGTGPNGDLVRAVLAEEGVEIAPPPLPDDDTALCVVMVEPTAERTFITSLGAERGITPEMLQTSDPQPGDVVCVSGYTLFEPTRDPLITWLESLPEGVDLILDPGAPFAEFEPDVRDRVLARTTVWSSNADEAQALTGVMAPATSCRAVAALLPEGAITIVRDGPRGCHVLVPGEDVVHVPGFPQVPVDTNGAGDAHTGALAAEMTRGTAWIEAARRANAVGGIKVTRKGPATAPTRAEVDALLAET